jgi:hypothetical protein
MPVAGEPTQRLVMAVRSTDFPAGTVVDLPGGRRPTGWLMAVRADVDGGRVHAVDVAMPDAPLCWYVELPEPEADPPAITLIAFSDTRFSEGTVLDAAQAEAAGVTAAHQVAAFRWWPTSGLVHQIYVGAAHRRRGLAVKLGQVAFGMQVARGLPHLHDDGRRTDLGEAWRQALPAFMTATMADRTEWLPPMTPAVVV